MNKVYKIIWSKARNCYVVASELAKSHTKAPKLGVMSRALVAGVLSCVLSCGMFFPSYSYAAVVWTDKGVMTGNGYDTYLGYDSALGILYMNPDPFYYNQYDTDHVIGIKINEGGSSSNSDPNAIYALAVNGRTITYTKGNGTTGTITTQDNNTTYSAGNGLTLSGTTFSAKGGTGIAVDGNGINIIAGSVANGNVNAITGDTAYSELRPANGTFVKSNQTTATNLTALDTASKNAIKELSTNGSVLTYTKGDGTTGTVSTFAKYVGVNSSDGINQIGEGASGEDAIAIGKNAKATKKGSIAIGLDSYAGEENVISLGHNKSEFDDELNQYVDSVTDNPVGSTALFTNDLNRRITNVADGIYSNDVATYGQLMSIQGGVVAQNNTKLISGSTAFSELRPADGQFIRRANTTAQNLTALDTMGKNAVKSMTIDGNMLVYTRGDNTSISLDLPTTGSGTSPISRFTGEGMTTTVGSVTAFASNSTPTGYLLCDGRAVSRTKYANLFRKIGTTYGAGDGSTTFNLPNLVNRFVEGSNVSGQYINAGLPNITGGHGAWNYNVTEGAFYGRSDLSENIKSGGWTSTGVGFDASRSNPIYGRSDTVQPESLMMQYYIKTDDEFNGSRYMGVNTNSGFYNEFGEGAVGTDATAIGRNASAKGETSVALGRDTVASGNNVVSVGHLATDINPATNVAYGSELNRKIINVADGSSDHDVATYGQMHMADNALSLRIGKNENDGHYVKKSSTNNLTKNVHILDTALFNTNNALATETQNRKDADVLLSNRIGTLGSDGNYIRTSEDLSTNVQLLDAQIHFVQNNLDAETEERVAQVNAINNRIGTLDNNGEYVDTNDTVFQNLMNLEDAIKTTNSNFENVVSYDSETFDKATLKGEDGTTLDNVKDGALSITSKEAVNGSQLYAEQQARLDADDALSNRIGSISTNGNYIRTGVSVYQNLQLLDDSIKGINTAMEDVVSYDSSNHMVVTLKGNGGTKLTNLKYASLSATSTDAVIGAQLYETNENIKGMTSDITRNKNNIRDLNTSVTAALSSVGSTSSLVNVLNGAKADASLNNLTATGKQVIANAAINAVQEYMASQQNNYVPPTAPMMYSANPNTLNVTDAGNGSLHVGEGSNVNGSQSIAIGVGNQVNANNSGAFGDPSIINADESYVLGNDDTINTGAIGSFVVGNDSVSSAKGGLTFGSNNTLVDTATDGVALGNNVTVSGVNSVALGSGSVANDANVVSVGNDSLKRKITNVLNGNISQDSSDAITGSQLFATNERVKTNEETIAQKANKDASNIDTVAWADRLGTGKIQESDSNLVTGGTVFNALSAVRQNDFVQATDEAIFIGPNQTDSMISVFNKNGEGRIVTGVVTNPEDASSAANVGYVNAVSESIIGAVNSSITQMDTKINKVGANAAAMASLTPASFEGDEKWSLSAGVGNYRGETAGAVGAFYRPVENVLMNVRGSFGNNENMVGAAVSVSLSKGDVPGVTKRQLANEVISLRQDLKQTKEQDRNQIAQLNQHIVHQDERIAELENLVQNMAKQINVGK